MRQLRGRASHCVFALAAVLALVLTASVSAASAFGEGPDEATVPAPALSQLLSGQRPEPKRTTVQASRHDTSSPLKNLTPVMRTSGQRVEAPENPAREVAPVKMPDFFDPTIQTTAPRAQMPATSVNFDGVNNLDSVLPPDTNGAVGATQYVQIVNLRFAVYNKSGVKLYGPASTNTLFAGFGGPCQTTNDGDPVVLYDQLANRWLVSQLALPNFPDGPFYQCIALSTTSDATGSWHRYQFKMSDTMLNDYPKFGVWPDAYYMSTNDFEAPSFGYVGVTAVAFERARMLSGLSAKAVLFELDAAFYSMLPSDLDGSTQPPAGAPNYFVQFDDNAWGYPADQLEVWKFHVDWANTANSTFTADPNLTTSSFNSSLPGIRQPNTNTMLDAMSDRLMHRLAYRNFGTRQTLAVNHTVNVGSNRAGIRWYELRKTSGNWSIFQQGTFAPSDGLNRWMGSIAMDQAGDIAAGYSTSHQFNFPSIRYVGRVATDPAGTLSAESMLRAGGGSQTHYSGRWGDYSAMSVDPVDDCTFWYTTEYYSATSSLGWKTRVGAFKYPGCSTAGAAPTITSFTPTSGPAGTSVVITGTNFTGATSVKFNGTAATFTVNQATQITATVPGAATSGAISVTTANGTATSATSFTVTSGGGGGPTITSFNPTSGNVGTIVTINGSSFSSVSSVKFNGVGATQWFANSSSQISAKVPTGATTGPISVTTPAGTGTSTTNFTVGSGGGGSAPVVSSFSPSSGPVGTTVTINGSGFSGVTSVKFNGLGAPQFFVSSSTKIFAHVPSGATTGKISVTTSAGTGTSSTNFTVT